MTISSNFGDLSGLILKRPVTLTMIVTPRWKEELQQQLQRQIDQINAQIKQVEAKGSQALIELEKQGQTAAIQQMQGQINQQRNQLLQKKNEAMQQLEQVQQCELNQEVKQTQPLESFCRIEKGDNLVKKMNIEIVMRDGIVEEIRGDI